MGFLFACLLYYWNFTAGNILEHASKHMWTRISLKQSLSWSVSEYVCLKSAHKRKLFIKSFSQCIILPPTYVCWCIFTTIKIKHTSIKSFLCLFVSVGVVLVLCFDFYYLMFSFPKPISLNITLSILYFWCYSIWQLLFHPLQCRKLTCYKNNLV